MTEQFDLSPDFLNEFGDPTIQDDPAPVKLHRDTTSSTYRCALCNVPVSKRGWYLCPDHYLEYRQVTDPKMLAVYKALFREVNRARAIEDQEGDPLGTGVDRVIYLEEFFRDVDGHVRQLWDVVPDCSPVYDPDGETAQREYESLLYYGQKTIDRFAVLGGLSPTEALCWREYLKPILYEQKPNNQKTASRLGMKESTFNKYLSTARAKVAEAIQQGAGETGLQPSDPVVASVMLYLLS